MTNEITPEQAKQFIKSLDNPNNYPILCLGSLEFHKLSYYGTNTRGTIIPNTSVDVQHLGEDSWRIPDAALEHLNLLYQIERYFGVFLSLYETNKSYYRKCNTVYDLINKLRFWLTGLNTEEPNRAKKLTNLLSIPHSTDYYFKVYTDYLEYLETANDDRKINIVGNVVHIGEFSYVAKYN